jgi:hypothetical protein
MWVFVADRNSPKPLPVTRVCYFRGFVSLKSGTIRIPCGLDGSTILEGRKEKEERIKERHSEI